ncbi:hypothetical protein B0H15DRAFT_988663 [Mycena belliarum]|uniref:Uncharacterized protein n=1 Tax=Mycena belliarum TaxID=1033014 RepID=A0AAD6XPE2_9AGAR|nr:hypothetical protein B0H15DRAFT_988663 [Mycena belliae]
MQSYGFDSPKILKGTVSRVEDGFLQYITSTTKSGFARQRTVVQDGSATAEIDWRERAFVIEGTRTPVDQLKRKVSNFTETRYWRWQHGEEYKARYSNADEMWTVTASTGEVVAELGSYISRPKTLPILRLAESLRSASERRFLLLVLLYSEAKRLDRAD